MILLHFLPNFGYSAAGRQVSLLAPMLRSLPARLDVHVAALGPEGPIAEALRTAGVQVHVLGAGRRFDPAWWRFRWLVRDIRPDIVHAWRLPALRAAGTMRKLGPAFRLVVSDSWHGGRPHPFDRWLLQSADAVIAGHLAEAHAIHGAGGAAELIHEIPLAVALPAADPPPLGVSLPAGAKVVVCVGNLTGRHGFSDAIWAADILRYAVRDLHLIVIGDGPDRAKLVRFARSINPAGDRAHFLPARPDAAALLARAEIVWVPSRFECGQMVLAEALAAGRPVVASALPGLAALVTDGQTGLLAPPGDPTELTRRTRMLLDDPALAARLGAAGREAVAAFVPERVAAMYAALYSQITASVEA